MNISKTWKFIIGICTAVLALFPFLFLFIFFAQFFFIFRSGPSAQPDPAFFAMFFLIFPIMMLMSFLQMGLLIFYLIHNIKNRSGSETVRILLGIGIYFIPFFAMPAYFLIYIWPETAPDWAQQAKTTTRRKLA